MGQSPKDAAPEAICGWSGGMEFAAGHRRAARRRISLGRLTVAASSRQSGLGVGREAESLKRDALEAMGGGIGSCHAQQGQARRSQSSSWRERRLRPARE